MCCKILKLKFYENEKKSYAFLQSDCNFYEGLRQPIDNLQAKDIPQNFDIEIITKFLRDSHIKISGVKAGSVEKPVVKGREMYHSRKILDCTYVILDDLLLFYAVMDASMEKEKR